jgi:hypothetical protein
VTNRNKDDARRAAESLLEQGFFSQTRDPALTVGEPLPIVDASGRPHSWFVPLQVGGKLAGFGQLSLTLEPLRFSSFQRNPETCDGCPDAAEWTDPALVLKKAAALAKAGERLSQPTLSFDQSPSRIAWRVEAKTPSGQTRTIYVAGSAAYEDTGARGLG